MTMTPLITKKGVHRLHDRLYFLSINMAAFAIASTYLSKGEAKFDPGDFMAFDCKTVEKHIRFPLHGPVQAAKAGQFPDEVHYTIAPKTPAQSVQPPQGRNNAKTLGPVTINFGSPIFVEYFEAYKDWLYGLLGRPDNWPPQWRFGRIVRNAISHNGCVKIDRQQEPPCTWNNLTYSYADNGRKIVLVDFGLADMILLLFEMDAELDKLNCPIVPP
jgi:hypothetical protein